MSIGARYHKLNRSKVSGADMLTGVLLALSYGKCPVDPTMYLFDNTEKEISISWDNLGSLIDHLAETLNKEFKPLTVGSAKQYLHALRRGFRANKNGTLPPLNVVFSEQEMMLYIPKRNFDNDETSHHSDFPSWIL